MSASDPSQTTEHPDLLISGTASVHESALLVCRLVISRSLDARGRCAWCAVPIHVAHHSTCIVPAAAAVLEQAEALRQLAELPHSTMSTEGPLRYLVTMLRVLSMDAHADEYIELALQLGFDSNQRLDSYARPVRGLARALRWARNTLSFVAVQGPHTAPEEQR